MRRVGVFILGAAALISVATLAVPQQASAYSTDQINNMLIGGTSTAYDMDRTCWDGLRRERNAGKAPRAAVNAAPSYNGREWISPQGKPSTSSLDVSYGTTSINLQLNAMIFICGALVSPDNQGADFGWEDGHNVNNRNNANDRAPNGIPGRGGSTVNGPAMTDSAYRINSARVIEGGGSISNVAGQTFRSPRDEGSRYWFSQPVGFTYFSDGEITHDRKITIELDVTGISVYYNTDYRCMVNAVDAQGYNYGRCPSQKRYFDIYVTVPYRYALTPSITVNGTDSQFAADSGITVPVRAQVAKSKDSTDSRATDWRVTEFRYSPGTQLSAGEMAAKSNSGVDPCAAFRSSGRTACNTFQREDSRVFNSDTASRADNYTVGDYAVGTRVCFVSSVSKPTQSEQPNWSHSKMVCIVVGKSPKVQVHGGDIRVGTPFAGQTSKKSIISTSLTIKTGRSYGSWSEYGMSATSTVSGAASAAALSGGLQSATLCSRTLLTFTNGGTSDCRANPQIGNFQQNRTIPDLASRYLVTTSTPLLSDAVTLDDVNAGLYKTNSSITISGQVAAGKSVIINAKGHTVTITSDVTYTTEPLTDARSIPQLVIIADTILVNSGVGQVDAWLVASNTVNTCADVDRAALTVNVCNRPLTINGPVMTGKLLLYRTAGSGTGAASGDPAEIINLRPDAYLWAMQQNAGSGRLETTYQRELPPRY